MALRGYAAFPMKVNAASPGTFTKFDVRHGCKPWTLLAILMSNFPNIELKNVDSGDIEDVLKKVEKSFDFQFGETELKNVKTFGELCDIITTKVQGVNIN